ncbi:MAG: hypothetical protein IPK22_26735 [Verrucomicrobiaceae bacterium]|nr:hypothetical protein [Verrucomicrobiaceae bacterium]
MKHSPFHLTRLASILLLLTTILLRPSQAQDAAMQEEEGKEGRVQYQLVLPDEKTPERVKPEENNPFESAIEAASRNAPEDTEENRVRDVLARLPVVGASIRPDGKMKVMLGDIMLQPGQVVPQVFADQQVRLTVKNITMQNIELAWEEKEATGLPPKVMLIAINMSPEIKYKLLGGQGQTGRITRPDSIQKNSTAPQPLASQPVPDRQAPPSSAPAETIPAATPPSPASIESSIRMLFGNPVGGNTAPAK